MDATGLVNLESALERLARDRTLVILAGVKPQPARVLEKAGIAPEDKLLSICPTVEAAIALARALRENAPMSTARPAHV